MQRNTVNKWLGMQTSIGVSSFLHFLFYFFFFPNSVSSLGKHWSFTLLN